MLRAVSAVLLDCRMPGMDGFQMAEHMKTLPRRYDCHDAHLDNRRHIKKAKELGIAKYMVKPVKKMADGCNSTGDCR